jgi:hypothetical protein
MGISDSQPMDPPQPDATTAPSHDWQADSDIRLMKILEDSWYRKAADQVSQLSGSMGGVGPVEFNTGFDPSGTPFLIAKLSIRKPQAQQSP